MAAAVFVPGLSPPATQKRRGPMIVPSQGDHGLRRSTLWPLWMSRMISVLQSLHQTGRPTASVSGSMRSSFLFLLQFGQVIHPFLTVILSRCIASFNPFCVNVSNFPLYFKIDGRAPARATLSKAKALFLAKYMLRNSKRRSHCSSSPCGPTARRPGSRSRRSHPSSAPAAGCASPATGCSSMGACQSG